MLPHSLEFFDCNAMIGRYYNPAFGEHLEAASLLAEYDRIGVAHGLVFHSKARDLFPPEGNRRLMQELGPHPRLHPAWVVTPHQTGEMPPPGELLAELKANNVRCVRIFCGPPYYMDAMPLLVFGDLLGILAYHRLPVMVELEGTMSMGGGLGPHGVRDLDAACREFPELRLILSTPKSTTLDRYLYALMERHEHFALETSGYHGFGGFEAMVSRFGAWRLLFGTRLPYYPAAATVAAVAYAKLGDDDKRNIAGGNLRRLMAEVQW